MTLKACQVWLILPLFPLLFNLLLGSELVTLSSLVEDIFLVTPRIFLSDLPQLPTLARAGPQWRWREQGHRDPQGTCVQATVLGAEPELEDRHSYVGCGYC